MVHNLTEADSGLYYCNAIYSIGTTMGHVELKVRCDERPVFKFKDMMVSNLKAILPPVNGYVALSYVNVHKLRLSVKSIGITAPLFTWYRIDVKFCSTAHP